MSVGVGGLFVQWWVITVICKLSYRCLSLLMDRWRTPKTLSVWWRRIQAPTGETTRTQNNTHTVPTMCPIMFQCCVSKANALYCRCFSFGIGEGASSALINGLAKEGGGHAQFITGADRMQPKVRHSKTHQNTFEIRNAISPLYSDRSDASSKLNLLVPFSSFWKLFFTHQVMQSLRFALHPTVVDISVTWDLPKGVSVTVLSPPVTTLFQGQRSLVYAQLSGQVDTAPTDNFKH